MNEITYRKNISRDLTPNEVDANFEAVADGYVYFNNLESSLELNNRTPIIATFPLHEELEDFVVQFDAVDTDRGYRRVIASYYQTETGAEVDDGYDIIGENNLLFQKNGTDLEVRYEGFYGHDSVLSGKIKLNFF